MLARLAMGAVVTLAVLTPAAAQEAGESRHGRLLGFEPAPDHLHGAPWTVAPGAWLLNMAQPEGHFGCCWTEDGLLGPVGTCGVVLSAVAATLPDVLKSEADRIKLCRAVDWLLAQQKRYDHEGQYGPDTATQAWATLGLTDQWVGAHVKMPQASVQAAADVLADAQLPSGGWSASVSGNGTADLRSTLLALMALYSVEHTRKLDVDDQVFIACRKWLDTIQEPQTGRFGSVETGRWGRGLNRAAAVALARCLLPGHNQSELAKAAFKPLAEGGPNQVRNPLGHLATLLAAYHLQNETWEQWQRTPRSRTAPLRARVTPMLFLSDSDVVHGSLLLAQLGSTEFTRRQDAEKRLLHLGDRARPLLRAALRHPDPEIQERASHIRRRLDRDRVTYGIALSVIAWRSLMQSLPLYQLQARR